MRRQLRRSVLPEGCETCADELQARNFQGLLAAQYDPFAHSPARKLALQLKQFALSGNPHLYPARMEFELSNKCNLECAMCNGSFSSSIRANREGLPPLPMEYDKRFVEQLKPFIPHLKMAKFFGGEPFLVDLYYDIWDLLIELNPSCEVAITTNATVFTAKVKRVLERLNCRIIVSLDSTVKSTYEAIRKNAIFETTLSNLEAFEAINRRFGRTTGLAVCPITTNWREMPELISFANRRQMTVVFNVVSYPKELSLKYLPVTLQAEIVSFWQTSLPPAENELEQRNAEALKDLCAQLRLWMEERSHPAPSQIRSRCRVYLEELNGERETHLLSLLKLFSQDQVTPPEIAAEFARYDENGPRDNVRNYFQAIWTIGKRLSGEGVLAGAEYTDSKLEEFLQLLEARVTGPRWKAVDRELRRYPFEILQLAGTRSPKQLFEQTRAHLFI